ncbi:hypothetical protein JX266_007744 [Neoarthrinium moseri]|nr:hypothetical protein JX266_007744 [Neoarthrinium moseri]
MNRFRASVSIGGMTCASCSTSILAALKNTDWVTDASVNLITNSASVEFSGADKAQQLVAAIEDLGYDAEVNQVEEVTDDSEQRQQRTVEVRIDGFWCDECPRRAVAKLLEGFYVDDQGHSAIEILTHPSKNRPIMKLRYLPEPSQINIRRIINTVNDMDPAFQATIYHPPSAEERHRLIHARQQKRLLLRLLGTLAVAIPTFIIGIVYMSLVPMENDVKMYLMEHLNHGISRSQVALLVLATPVYFCVADIFHRRAIKEIWLLWRPSSRTPLLQRFYRFGSMNMLMSLGTTIAYVSSCAQLIAAAVHPPSGMVDDSNFYFDSVVFLTLFLLAGRLIESYSKSKTGSAIEALGKLRPTSASLLINHSTTLPSQQQSEAKDERSQIHDTQQNESLDEVVQPEDRIETVSVDMLDFGDTILVSHGASPPCDGLVTKGGTLFDESSLTGESRLVKKSIGDKVFAGTINKGSPVRMEVTDIAGQSMLDQIVNVVREGQTKRAPMERVADSLTSYFVPAITFIAILTWLIWFVLGSAGIISQRYLNDPSESWVVFALQFSIAVFVVACPCGLGLAAPTAIYVGGGLAAKFGILAKGGGEAFEKASHLKCIVFDKTGTLTEGGDPRVVDWEFCSDKMEPKYVLSAIRNLEQNSSHPLAKALISYCESEAATDVVTFSHVEEIPGKGLKGVGWAAEYVIGNETLMNEMGVYTAPDAAAKLRSWKQDGNSVVLVATRQNEPNSIYRLAAFFEISTPIRSEAAPTIAALQDRGVDVWMLSGDNSTTARAVALRVGIPTTNVIAEVLPTDKSSKILELREAMTLKYGAKNKRATIAMVGDGINDAPALAVADVGIAIGSGTDVAISSADFVLVKSDLRSVVTLLGVSKTVFRRIKFNFGWAVIYNLLAIPFAAGCFYVLGVKLDPVWASLAMALSSISVVLSSLALNIGIPGLGFRERKIPIGEV